MCSPHLPTFPLLLLENEENEGESEAMPFKKSHKSTPLTNLHVETRVAILF
jgi:hypothetical protein